MATQKKTEDLVKKSVFETLSAIDVKDKIEKKNGLSYLSWAWAWGIVKKFYPTASYKVIESTNEKGVSLPYIYDELLGYLVRTEVTIEGDTIPMQLPVMDGANKAQKATSYTYKTKFGEKTVEAATMFDINTSIMRCMTKNLAMHGLGYSLYVGEDLPVDRLLEGTNDSEKPKTTSAPKSQATTTKASDKPKLVRDSEQHKAVIKALETKQRTIAQVVGHYQVDEALLKELKEIK